MIYIDPPYNTGMEFIYPDKYTESLETYLAYAGLVDDEGRKFSTNTPSEGRYHTKWLNMMYPRLYLARNLLREDGIIFISIDDNEVSNLRKLCDGVFGEENFIDCIIWKKRYGGGAKEKYLVSLHEYVLLYAKNETELNEIFIPLSEDSIRRYYTQRDSNYSTRGPYRTHPLEATKSMGERQNLVFAIPAPDGTEVWPMRQWLWGRERVNEALKKDELEFRQDRDEKWSVHTKQYLKDEEGNIRAGKAFSIIDDVYTQHGTNEIIDLFGNAQIFPFPKPSGFVEKLLQIGLEDPEDIVLDFFAGSCATAHAVLNMNRSDERNHMYIMIQLPEPCEEGTEAKEAGYYTIADIGKERIRRVIQKIEVEQKNQHPELFEGGKSSLHLGFKVLKLDRSNFKGWDGTDTKATEEELGKTLEAFVEHIDPEATQEDILYELLLKTGFMPTVPIEKLELADKTVYSIEEGALLICLEDEMTKELIDAMAEAEPQIVICLDRGFKGNDQLKANAVQTFKARHLGEEKESQIVFRTV
ncbi:hypothetical protein ES703_47286 [subsurface metagenome]